MRRVHDKEQDCTTLDLSMEQAREAYSTLGEVLDFFDSHGHAPVAPVPVDPNQTALPIAEAPEPTGK